MHTRRTHVIVLFCGGNIFYLEMFATAVAYSTCWEMFATAVAHLTCCFFLFVTCTCFVQVLLPCPKWPDILSTISGPGGSKPYLFLFYRTLTGPLQWAEPNLLESELDSVTSVLYCAIPGLFSCKMCISGILEYSLFVSFFTSFHYCSFSLLCVIFLFPEIKILALFCMLRVRRTIAAS